MQQLDGPSLSPLSGGAPKQLVVLLHGYGSNGADLISLAPMWRQSAPRRAVRRAQCSRALPRRARRLSMVGAARSRPSPRSPPARAAAPVLDAYLDGLLAEHGLE